MSEAGVAASPAPDPLAVAAFDSHCHLDLLDTPPGQALAAARRAGIARIVAIGVDVESSRWAAECAGEHDDVWAAVAIHPNQSGPLGEPQTAAALSEIEQLAGLEQVRAVGETGLDYYRDWADAADQRSSFRAHIGIARRTGKALVIHDREAHADVLKILEEEGPPDRVVFHCFSGDAEMARICAASGYFISFAGNVTFKNAAELRDAARVTPPESLLVETDAPFMAPVPHRGKPNAPYLVPHTVRALAGIKDIDVDELCAAIAANGERVFGPW